MQGALNAEEKNRIIQQTRDLQARQTQFDDPNVLPKVGLADIPPELNIAEGHTHPVAALPATWYTQGTNGMVYQQLVIDLPYLDDELVDLVPLFCLCVTEVGSGGRDYLETQALQAAVTGGLSARCLVRSGIDDSQQIRGVMVLAGKALARNQDPLAKLLLETFVSARFDELPRLRELIAQWRAQREEAIIDQGHFLAMTAASAGLSPTTALSHRWDGLRGLHILKALDDKLDDQTALAALASQLERLQDLLKTAPRQLLVVSEAERQEEIAAALTAHWQAYPSSVPVASKFILAPVATQICQGWSASTQVSFCAKAYPTVPPNHPDAAALQVLGELLRNGYLHRAVREQGGAYGAGSVYHGDSGVFRLFSYRDPRLTETLDDFDHALRWLQETTHSQETLEEAILGVISAIDRPGSPAGEAISAFFGSLFGRTPEQRRTFRQRILQVTVADIQRVAATYLLPERASVAAISDAETLKKQEALEILFI
jgi:hypothetical protein